jgi:hypothetical protein
MANRHTHKKLRAEIRARMIATGESYQKARARILSSVAAQDRPRTDLVPVSYFGIPATLATLETHGVAVLAVVPSSTLWGRGYPHPFPLPLLRGLLRTRGVQ